MTRSSAWASSAYFIPFLFMFAAMIVLQREPAGPDVMRVPGGKPVAVALASVGFFVTAVSIVLACIPPDEEPNKTTRGGQGRRPFSRARGNWRGGVSVGTASSDGGFMTKFVAFAWLVVHASVAVAAPNTMRVDYYHTGNAKEERFSLDRIVLEPLPWAGNPAQPLDTTNRGKYFFEMIDPSSGRVLYSRGFSSNLRRVGDHGGGTRPSSDLLGVAALSTPDSPVRIVVKKRDPRNVFREAWSVKRRSHGQVHRALVPRPTPGALIPLAPDARPGPEARRPDSGRWLQRRPRTRQVSSATRAASIATLFATSPFKERPARHQRLGLVSPAAQLPASPVRRSTSIDARRPSAATYDAFDSERYVLTFENKAFRDIAANAPTRLWKS